MSDVQYCARCKEWVAPEVAGHTTHWYACPFCGSPTSTIDLEAEFFGKEADDANPT